MAEFGAMTADELFYLQAVKTLARLESGDTAYDIWTAIDAFIEEPYLGSRFEAELGRALGPERGVARGMFAAIYTPDHHNLPFEGFVEDIDELDQQAADYVRTAMWSFIACWNHRYGGFNADLVKRGTLVDPRLRDPGRTSS